MADDEPKEPETDTTAAEDLADFAVAEVSAQKWFQLFCRFVNNRMPPPPGTCLETDGEHKWDQPLQVGDEAWVRMNPLVKEAHDMALVEAFRAIAATCRKFDPPLDGLPPFKIETFGIGRDQ